MQPIQIRQTLTKSNCRMLCHFDTARFDIEHDKLCIDFHSRETHRNFMYHSGLLSYTEALALMRNISNDDIYASNDIRIFRNRVLSVDALQPGEQLLLAHEVIRCAKTSELTYKTVAYEGCEWDDELKVYAFAYRLQSSERVVQPMPYDLLYDRPRQCRHDILWFEHITPKDELQDIKQILKNAY